MLSCYQRIAEQQRSNRFLFLQLVPPQIPANEGLFAPHFAHRDTSRAPAPAPNLNPPPSRAKEVKVGVDDSATVKLVSYLSMYSTP
jgi:hypothetical protein